MDIQNIQALSALLKALEFSSGINEKLIWHACLRQKEFCIKEHKAYGHDCMTYQVFFKENTANGKLVCAYYDAALRKQIQHDTTIVNGINIQKLDYEMKAMNWKNAAQYQSDSEFDLSDMESWKQQADIEKVILSLEVLGATGEGRTIADTLKYKYWIGLSLENMIPNLYYQRSKFEFNQQFYIIGEEGITAIEAYRFLNNRWMQRQAQEKKKTDTPPENKQKTLPAKAKERKSTMQGAKGK